MYVCTCTMLKVTHKKYVYNQRSEFEETNENTFDKKRMSLNNVVLPAFYTIIHTHCFEKVLSYHSLSLLLLLFFVQFSVFRDQSESLNLSISSLLGAERFATIL